MRNILKTLTTLGVVFTVAYSVLPVKDAPQTAKPVITTAQPAKGLRAYAERIKASAAQNAISASLLAAVLKRESGFDPSAASSVGAKGIAQFMDATALQYAVDVNDPHSSIDGCARMLRDMLDASDGNVGVALARYNWGYGNVSKWLARGAKLDKMPKETRAYVYAITGVSMKVWSGKAKGIDDLIASVALDDFIAQTKKDLK